jgi:hypothetical protein
VGVQRLSNSGRSGFSYKSLIAGITPIPSVPTIGSATAVNFSSVNVAFTAPGAYAGSTYTATSSPGGLTGTSASSPILVTGLSELTAYTFTVTATNATGTSAASAASDAVTTPSGDNGVMFPIGMARGTGSSGVITFSSIPQTYKHLQLRCTTGTTGGTATALTINSGSFARRHYLYSSGGAGNPIAGADTGNDLFVGSNTTTYPLITAINIYDILDYTNTNKTKTYRGLAGADFNGSGDVFIWSGLDLSTTAINTITLTTSSNFSTTTQISLYGIKGV